MSLESPYYYFSFKWSDRFIESNESSSQESRKAAVVEILSRMMTSLKNTSESSSSSDGEVNIAEKRKTVKQPIHQLEKGNPVSKFKPWVL